MVDVRVWKDSYGTYHAAVSGARGADWEANAKRHALRHIREHMLASGDILPAAKHRINLARDFGNSSFSHIAYVEV